MDLDNFDGDEASPWGSTWSFAPVGPVIVLLSHRNASMDKLMNYSIGLSTPNADPKRSH